jgi:hypothetical protein
VRSVSSRSSDHSRKIGAPERNSARLIFLELIVSQIERIQDAAAITASFHSTMSFLLFALRAHCRRAACAPSEGLTLNSSLAFF